MLHLSMKTGDYITIGSDTVLQLSELTGEQVHLTINAPREVPILRGDVLERGGGQRPSCVREKPPLYVKQLPWNHVKKKALLEIRETLAQMGDSPETRLLKQKIDCIFPQIQPQNTGAAKAASG